MDARRGEVYTATFVGKDGELIRKSEDRAIPISLLAEELREVTVPIYLVGDGYTVAKKALTELQIKTEDTPLLLRDENAASVAAVAYIKYKNGEVTDDLSLSPLYLRLPQAERERLEREGQSGK
jgi:tRNA threonylcarbamoyladenosine biosynthesis protein TsaB